MRQLLAEQFHNYDICFYDFWSVANFKDNQ